MTAIDRDVVSNAVPVINRADRGLVDQIHWVTERCRQQAARGKEFLLVWELGQPLLTACRNAVSEPPIFWDMHYPK